MMRAILPLMCLAALAACSEKQTPAEKAASDARDVAMVERAQQQIGPAQPVSLQPVTWQDIEKTGLSGPGCSFAHVGEENGDLLVTIGLRGFVKVDGALVQLAGDAGSPEFPYGTRGRLTGREFMAVVAKDDGDGRRAGEDLTAWPATLTLRDAHGRAVFNSVGELSCGS